MFWQSKDSKIRKLVVPTGITLPPAFKVLVTISAVSLFISPTDNTCLSFSNFKLGISGTALYISSILELLMESVLNENRNDNIKESVTE